MLEEIRAQNAATIAAVHDVARKIRCDLKSRELKGEVARLKRAVQRQEGPVENQVDLARIEALEQRVAALEVSSACR